MISVQPNPELSGSDVISPAVIELGSMLTIRHAGATKDKLLSAIEGAVAVKVAIDPGAEADLSFIQLMEAARLQASLQGMAFDLARPAQGQLLETLERAGLGSQADPSARAFWFHEKD